MGCVEFASGGKGMRRVRGGGACMRRVCLLEDLHLSESGKLIPSLNMLLNWGPEPPHFQRSLVEIRARAATPCSIVTMWHVARH